MERFSVFVTRLLGIGLLGLAGTAAADCAALEAAWKDEMHRAAEGSTDAVRLRKARQTFQRQCPKEARAVFAAEQQARRERRHAAAAAPAASAPDPTSANRRRTPATLRNGPSTCGLNAFDPPDCDLANALITSDYLDWERETERQCVDHDALAKGNRDHCATRTIERALAERQVTAEAVARCRQDDPRPGAVKQCLLGMAIVDRARRSRVVNLIAAGKSPPIDLRGYRQPGTLDMLWSSDWAGAPVPDSIYVLNLFGRFGAACPDLGYADLIPRLVERESRATSAALTRAVQGQGTMQDLVRLLAEDQKMAEALQNCNDDPPDSWEREQCEREQEMRRDAARSPDADHDATLWLQRNACGSVTTRRLGNNLAEWVLLDDGRRGSMAWAAGHPQRTEYMALFDRCRRQAGDGAADAWCSCYVDKLRLEKADDPSLYRSSTALRAARDSAFVGNHLAWFVPRDLDACAPHAESLARWRKEQRMRPTVTACLTDRAQAPDRLQPDTETCRYRTAWGEIEYNDRGCRDRLYAHQWGGMAVMCENPGTR